MLARPASTSSMGMLTGVRSVVPAGFSSGGSVGWFAGDLRAAFSLGPFVSQAASSTFARNGLELSPLRSGAMVWFSAADKNVETPATKTGGSGRSSPPPTPPPSGLSDKAKAIFVKMLTEFQNQMKKLPEDVKADIRKKKLMIKIGLEDITETRNLVEAVIKELNEKGDANLLIPKLEKFAKALAAMEADIAQKGKKEFYVHLAEFIYGEFLGYWMVEFALLGAAIFKFCQGKVLFLLLACACLSCGVGPVEGFQISMLAIKEMIDDKRSKIKKLQDKNAGKEVAEDVDVGKVLIAFKEMIEDQGSVIKGMIEEQGSVIQKVADVKSSSEQDGVHGAPPQE